MVPRRHLLLLEVHHDRHRALQLFVELDLQQSPGDYFNNRFVPAENVDWVLRVGELVHGKTYCEAELEYKDEGALAQAEYVLSGSDRAWELLVYDIRSDGHAVDVVGDLDLLALEIRHLLVEGSGLLWFIGIFGKSGESRTFVRSVQYILLHPLCLEEICG